MRNKNIALRFLGEVGLSEGDIPENLLEEISDYNVGWWDIFNYVKLYIKYNDEHTTITDSLINNYISQHNMLHLVRLINYIRFLAELSRSKNV